jgi:hypothetical protein
VIIREFLALMRTDRARCCIRDPGMGTSCLVSLPGTENHIDDGLVADCGIHHSVINRAVRPFDLEILLDKMSAFAVDVIHQFFGFLFGFATTLKPAYLSLSWGVQEYAQSVGPVLEKLLRPSTYDDALPAFGSMLNDTFRNPEYGLAIDKVELGRVDAALIASAKEGFEKPVVQRIVSFLPLLHHRFGAIREPGNLLGQALVPQFPAEAVCEQLSDFSAAASVFAFHSDDVDHECQLPSRYQVWIAKTGQGLN